MGMSESVTEFSEVFLPTFLHHLFICKSWGSSDGDTDSSPPSFISSQFLVCCEWMLHENPQASILLEMDLSVGSESYYYNNCYCCWSVAALLHCCSGVVALRHCCIAALLHCGTAALLHCCTAALLHCCTAALLHCYAAAVLKCAAG